MTNNELENPNAQKRGLVLSERAYNLLKDLTTIALPTIVAGFGGFAQIWGVPDDLVAKIVGTVAFVIVVLGVLLKISNVRYQKDLEIAAVKAASIEEPRIVVSPSDPTRVVVSGPNASPAEITVEGGSQ